MLAATNDTIDVTNEIMLNQIPEPSIHCYSIDTVLDDNQAAHYSTEFLNSIELSGIPQHDLHLKKGAVIFLMRNLRIEHQHCNGSRYIIQDVSAHLITAQRLSSSDPNDVLLIPQIPHLTKDTDFPFIMKRLQFPVKVAFAMTFNRAQGQSLAKCGILLPRSVWTHGQLYVAFSRCSDPQNVKVFVDQENFEDWDLPEGTFTHNVVYTEILHRDQEL